MTPSRSAKLSALEELHAKLAETLTDAIAKGVPLETEEGPLMEDGKVVRAPAPAAILNVARQFLKDNDIKSLPTGDTPLERLQKAIPAGTTLPFEGEDHPTH